MKNTDFIKPLGGKSFMIAFSVLLVSATIIVWCLTSSLSDPLRHLSCPLFSLLQ